MDLGSTSIIVVAASLGAVAAFSTALLARRALRARADARALAENVARQRDLPRSLHPAIDADRCIGSLSCLRSCPEGDILGIVDGAARLIHADHCVGHGQCAAECPVNAIQLVFGTARRGVDLPELDELFESSRPGVHVIGELGGMGLIKNAMRQGLECAGYLAQALARASNPPQEMADVLIVGAGPAGLAAALRARAEGLRYRLLEQGALGGAVAHSPRQKVVMTETVELPFYGRFGRKRMSKEELLASFEAIVAKGELRVEAGVKVTAVEGEEGALEVVTERGERIRGRKVVLAVGRRGTPRKLGGPGEELSKVTYSLADPEQYRGAKVLVVGGGDSALEAAMQLAREGGALVSLSYRGDALGRCREENRRAMEALASAGSLRLLLSSRVRAVAEREVVVDVAGRDERLPNDFVVVSIGGELPADLLRASGVAMRRYHGEAPGAGRRRGGGAAREGNLRAGLERDRARRRSERRLAACLVLAGAAVVALLAFEGRHYYPLGPVERLASPFNRSLRAAGPWGHGVGVVATAFMLSNFLYAARKHLRVMTGVGPIRTWLHFHVFVGFMSPLVIAFHAAFQSRNLLATGTASALAMVVASGIVGRYLYGLVPSDGGSGLEAAELQARLVRLQHEVSPILDRVKGSDRVKASLERLAAPAGGGTLLGLLATAPFRALRARADLLGLRRAFADSASFEDARDAVLRMRALRVQIGFYGSLKRLLGSWRVVHASLAAFLVLAIAAHIAVSLYLGYGLFR